MRIFSIIRAQWGVGRQSEIACCPLHVGAIIYVFALFPIFLRFTQSIFLAIFVMKRKGSPSSEPSAKRPRQARPTLDLMDTKSVREQAEPYRLVTAKFPIEALTPVWKVGSNRQIDTKHVESLCRIFKEQRLQREPEENHLRIACSQAEVQRMVDHVNPTGTLQLACLPFDDWMVVNGTKAELMAGQHRVEALRLYLQNLSSQSKGTSLEKEHSWWICDIYDIGEYDGRPCSCIGLIVSLIDFPRSSAFSFVRTGWILHCPTVTGRCGWSWFHWPKPMLPCSKGKMALYKMRCFKL